MTIVDIERMYVIMCLIGICIIYCYDKIKYHKGKKKYKVILDELVKLIRVEEEE